MILKKTLICSSILLSTTILGQDWQVGGNPLGPPAFAVTPTKNFLGSDATNNTWIRFGVQGSQDIMIDNNQAQLYPVDPNGLS